MEAFGGSSSGMFYGESSHVASPKFLPPSSTQPVPPTNSHCPRGAVVHALTATTQSSNSKTILSIDGVGAYDTISRNSMLSGLLHTPEANRCLPFVRLWYTTASEYVWHDATAPSTPIHKQRGVNKGTPSCRPCSLWAKSQPYKPALQASPTSLPSTAPTRRSHLRFFG